MKNYNCLTSSHLKIIAIISMAIDHFGAVFLGAYALPYALCRTIGRLAFPIFCFLLSEGFYHTSNRKNYFLRLLAFAFIAEIPFNLAFTKEIIHFGGLNVFFSLCLGFAAIWVLDSIDNLLISIPSVLCLCALASIMGTDYKWYGVALIIIFYLLRKNLPVAMVCFAAVTLIYSIWAPISFLIKTAGTYNVDFSGFINMIGRQPFAILAILPIAMYNGEKGFLKNKYFFYAFYPVHLFVFYAISLLV